MLFITKPCINCGKISKVELEEEKFMRWQGGEYVQNVFPEMSPEDREVLITGTHPECWDKMFPEEEEEAQIVH